MAKHQHRRPPSPQVIRRRRLLAVTLVVAAVIGVVAGLVATSGSSSSPHTRVASATHEPVHPTTSAPAGSSTTAAPLQPGAATPTATAAPTTATTAPAGSGPLAGKVVAIDPGHNGGNADDPSYINAPIFNGRETEACDTAGASTDGGYTEAEFNFNVATEVAADLQREGAKVVLTRTNNTGVGPCVTQRAAIGNQAHADAALSIHADGGPASGRGFAILEPVADGPNDAIVAPSQTLGSDLRSAFLNGTGEPVSSYDGTNGIQPRDDLGGINLSTVPKVFIECANMRNATDAALLVTPAWQQKAADAIAQGLTAFLTGGG